MVGEEPPYLTPEEREKLANAAKNGDREAFMKLFLSYLKVFRSRAEKAMQYYSYHGPFSADDFVHNALLEAKASVEDGKFDPTRSFYGYVSTKIKWMIIRETKKTPPVPELPEGEPLELVDPKPPDGPEIVFKLELIELICASSARPHQAIALFFIKLLQWEPREFVKKYSNGKLEDLAKEFVDEYPKIYNFTPQKVRERCTALFEKMEEKTREGDSVGSLPMKSFYGKVPTDSLSDWCDKVKNRVRMVVITGQLCEGMGKQTEETV